MHKINKTSPDKQDFLQRLLPIDKTVKTLWFIGELPQASDIAIAIVGSRKPTSYGQDVTYRLSTELAKRGIIIISGLALGIDGIAHQAALNAGGKTIAVLPTSLDQIYPSSHRKLANQIIDQGGALISEYPPGTNTQRWNFVRRNRIVSGLSNGVLITEAAAHSGTLSTANFALSQGKPVMAVPGNITSPNSLGCNRLISTGARLITNVHDVLDEINLADSHQPAQLPLVYSKDQAQVIKIMLTGIQDGEELQRQSGLDPTIFNQTLTMLELEDKIKALNANQWMIKR